MSTPRHDTVSTDSATEVSAPVALERVLGNLPETELDEGDRLGAWRLVRRLAQGGMGAVYLAERADGHFEQHAAIKLIRGVPNAEMLAHFTRERQILATLQHPNIARLLDGGATPGGQPYLVMEYVEGEPIDVYCNRNELTLDARLKLFEQVCDAVQFAHQRLIVHCDLKPSNVLVRADGTPVLLDFGIARALDRQRRASAVEAGYFTPGYASPEQLKGDAVSTATDVYSLGLILFEMIAGRKARIDAADRTIALLGDAAVRPSEIADAVPWRGRLAGDLDAIVLRATAADPAGRYAAADMLAGDIQRHRDFKPVSAREPTLIYVASRLFRRRWPVFAAGALIAALIAAFTWRLAAERDRALVAEREARVQATTAERVSDFLVSVFNVSNPKVNQQRDISAREVLDQGAARIHTELADQPAVKAKLLDTLATAYRFIGQPKQEVALFREAVDLYLDPRVNDPLAAAAALSQLAVAYSNNRYPRADAEAAARRALELREKNRAPVLAMADSYNTLGIVLEAGDKFDEAQTLLKKGLALRRENGATPSTIASSLHNLALVEVNSGHPKDSYPYYAEALKLRKESIGEHSPEYEMTLQNYGTALARGDNAAEAIRVLEQSLAIARELYGDDSANTGAGHNEIGSALHDLGRFRDAAAHYREAMRINGLTAGEDSAERAKPLNNLASAFEDMGDYAAAIPLFRESLAIRKKSLEANDAMVLRADYNLARVLTRAGLLKEAKPMLDGAHKEFVRKYGEANASTAKAELWIGVAQLKSGDIAAASASLATLQASKATFTPLMRAQRAAFAADIAAARHDNASELAAREEAWNTMRDARGAEYPLAAEFGIAYAVALADAGRAQDAKAVASPLVAIVDDAFADVALVKRQAARWR